MRWNNPGFDVVCADDLPAVESDWRALSAYAGLFVDHLAWVTNVAAMRQVAGWRLRWFSVRDSRGPAFVGVLQEHQWRWKNIIPVASLESVSFQEIQFAGSILRPDADPKLIARGLSMLTTSTGRRWDSLKFDALRSGSSLLRVAAALPCSSMGISAERGISTINTSGPHSEWEARLSAKFKYDLRSSLGKLSRLGAVEFQTLTTRDAVEPVLEEFLELEASGYKRDHGTAVKETPLVLSSLRTAARNLSQEGKVFLHTLRLDGRLVAGNFCLLAGSTMYGLKTAYAEDLARIGPGKVLMMEVIRSCFDIQGVAMLDFCSYAEWNERFCVDVVPLFHVHAYNTRAPAGFLAHALKRSRTAVRPR